MKSIRGGFALYTLVSIVALSLVLGTISVVTIVRKSERDAADLMNLTCANEADKIDVVLESIEDAVDIEVSYMQEMLGSEEGLAALAAVAAGEQPERSIETEVLSEAEALFAAVAENTNGAIVYYVRLDGDALPDALPAGFLCLRDDTDQPFRSISFAESGAALPGEGEGDRVGWDFEALHSGHALWLEPLLIDDINVLMASYVEPLFVNGEYVGVVGMGVDFQVIIDLAATISAYETGYAFLTDADENVMYHPNIAYGTNLASDDDQDVPEVDAAIAAGTTVDDVVTYRYYGQDKRMAFHLLQNDMRLVISVEASEIYADRNRLVLMLVATAVVAAAGFVAATMAVGGRLLRPLDELTEEARRVAEGDLDVNILAADTRELSSLVDSYKITVGELRGQIEFVNQLARTDALTGLLNVNAYNETIKEIEPALVQGEGSLCLVMLDVNDLKPVNDTLGHEAGDELLREAANLISEAFESFLAFRVGGDEFVVLTSGELAEEVERCIERLEELCEERSSGEDVPLQRQVRIAAGYAVYDPERDSDAADVLARADAAMYARKQEMKPQRSR